MPTKHQDRLALGAGHAFTTEREFARMPAAIDSTQVKEVAAIISGKFALAVAVVSAVVSLIGVYLTSRLASGLEKQKASDAKELQNATKAHDEELLRIKNKYELDLLDLKRKHDEELLFLRSTLERQELAFREAGPDRALVMQHLVKTKELVGSTYARFAEFVLESPQLALANVLPRATDTLDLYADLREHLKHHFFESSYPPDLQVSIRNAQKHLAALFLDVQFPPTTVGAPQTREGRIAESLANLEAERLRAVGIIDSYTAIRLPTPPASR